MGSDYVNLDEAIEWIVLERDAVGRKRLGLAISCSGSLALRGVENVGLDFELAVKLSVQKVSH